MQKRIGRIVMGSFASIVVCAAAQAQSAAPWLGTWKVDAKSTYSPGPKPAGGTVKIERSGDRMKTTIDGTNAQGQPTHTETVWMFDGTDHPVNGAPAPNATALYKRVDDRTFEVTSKADGKPFMTTRVSISADGKTMTATQTGKNPPQRCPVLSVFRVSNAARGARAMHSQNATRRSSSSRSTPMSARAARSVVTTSEDIPRIADSPAPVFESESDNH